MKHFIFLERDRIRTTIGISISLLVHASFLFLLFTTQMPKPPQSTGSESRVPLVVELNMQPPGPKAAPLRPATPAVQARPARPAPKKRPAPPPPPRAAAPPRSPAATRPAPPPAPASPTPDNAPPPSDMAEMVAAARAPRRAAGIPAPGERANEEGARPRGDVVARANIAHSLAQASGRSGAGGIFHITHKGVRNAEFLFRGWDNDSRAGVRELVEVDAGPNGNVEDAIVRKMIEIIRRHQPGDFNWNSHRLGRVVVLSARREDNAGLEDFLKKEFFDSLR
jgi:hypothetical protein